MTTHPVSSRRWLPIWTVAVGLLLIMWGLTARQDFLARQNWTFSPAELNLLAEYGLTQTLWAIYILIPKAIGMLVYCVIAILIATRRRHEPRMLLLAFIVMLSGFFTSYIVPAARFPNPTMDWIRIIVDGLAVTGFAALFLTFPDGRFVPRWTVLMLPLFAVYAETWILFPQSPLADDNNPLTVVLLGGFVLIGLGSLIYRYRRIATPTQQQQMKWALFGLGVTLLGTVVFESIRIALSGTPTTRGEAFYHLFLDEPQWRVVYLVLPITVGIAILRDRLWDIDLIIRRTLIYSALTAILAGVYFGGVTLLQAIFTNVTGSDSTLAVVISTLAIAALFRPLQTRLQRFIDRRFFRQKYDPARVLTDFAEAVRDEIDVEDVEAALLRAINDTMQPESVGLWLREGRES